MKIKERVFFALLLIYYVNLGLPFRVRHREDIFIYIQVIW